MCIELSISRSSRIQTQITPSPTAAESCAHDYAVKEGSYVAQEVTNLTRHDENRWTGQTNVWRTARIQSLLPKTTTTIWRIMFLGELYVYLIQDIGTNDNIQVLVVQLRRASSYDINNLSCNSRSQWTEREVAGRGILGMTKNRFVDNSYNNVCLIKCIYVLLFFYRWCS
jgi:hypothetical protein